MGKDLNNKGNTVDIGIPAARRKDGRLLVLCDFDGTVCMKDMGNDLLNRFAEGWEEIDRAYCAGEVGSRIAYSRLAPLFRTDREKLLAHVLKEERIDPSFSAFCSYAKEKRIDVKIISDGLDVYIEAILDKHGLDVEFFSNGLTFRENDRIDFVFPLASEECGLCGTCKRSLLRRFRTAYDRIIYVGDGYSDVCPAREADVVFAKNILYEKCRGNGTPCRSYRNFEDVRRYLNDRTTAGLATLPAEEKGSA